MIFQDIQIMDIFFGIFMTILQQAILIPLFWFINRRNPKTVEFKVVLLYFLSTAVMIIISSIIPQIFIGNNIIVMIMSPLGTLLMIYTALYVTKIIRKQKNTLKKQAEKVISILDAGSAASIEVASHATELAASASEVNAAAEEITHTAIQISELTNKQVESMESIDQMAEEIRGIAKIIKNISEQTNLLALNASIEAGRAGEHGRGFAVVAERVQKLSEESKNSVDKSNSIIESISRNISETVELSKKVFTVFEEINGATEEQTSSMEEITATANKLGALAENLKNLLAKHEKYENTDISKGISNTKKEFSIKNLNLRIKK